MSAKAEAQGHSSAGLLARGLSHAYGAFTALDSVSLQVSPGELVALVGRNGAGKTTFLSVAAGLLEPSDGSLAVAGSPAGSIAARAATSYVPDTPVFYGDLSLNEHLDYIGGLHGVGEGSVRSVDLLERFDLASRGDGLPTDFSRGMRQKASLALAWVRPFSVLLADEPYDGLDAASRPILTALLREACDEEAAAVISTHDVEVAAAADRCVGLRDGQIEYDGPANTDVVRRLFAAN